MEGLHRTTAVGNEVEVNVNRTSAKGDGVGGEDVSVTTSLRVAGLGSGDGSERLRTRLRFNGVGGDDRHAHPVRHFAHGEGLEVVEVGVLGLGVAEEVGRLEGVADHNCSLTLLQGLVHVQDAAGLDQHVGIEGAVENGGGPAGGTILGLGELEVNRGSALVGRGEQLGRGGVLVVVRDQHVTVERVNDVLVHLPHERTHHGLLHLAIGGNRAEEGLLIARIVKGRVFPEGGEDGALLGRHHFVGEFRVTGAVQSEVAVSRGDAIPFRHALDEEDVSGVTVKSLALRGKELRDLALGLHSFEANVVRVSFLSEAYVTVLSTGTTRNPRITGNRPTAKTSTHG